MIDPSRGMNTRLIDARSGRRGILIRVFGDVRIGTSSVTIAENGDPGTRFEDALSRFHTRAGPRAEILNETKVSRYSPVSRGDS